MIKTPLSRDAQLRKSWVATLVAMQVQRYGGCRICQESGVIYALSLIDYSTLSSASAIQKGIALGKEMMKKKHR